MRMTYLQVLLFIVLCAMPGLMYAGAANMSYFEESAGAFAVTVRFLIPVLIGLAMAVFIWGLVVFIFHSGDDSAKQEGKNKMIWGILALFVIVSIWGIVTLLQNITGATSNTPPTTLPTGGLGLPS